ncbi:MAG: hypothetical protein ACOC23_09610 [Thermodesulfobacteriota bacterium]
MKRIGFEELSEDDLFWMGQTENPQGPQEFRGPYKKKVYQDWPKPPPTSPKIAPYN